MKSLFLLLLLTIPACSPAPPSHEFLGEPRLDSGRQEAQAEAGDPIDSPADTVRETKSPGDAASDADVIVDAGLEAMPEAGFCNIVPMTSPPHPGWYCPPGHSVEVVCSITTSDAGRPLGGLPPAGSWDCVPGDLTSFDPREFDSGIQQAIAEGDWCCTTP